jgi:hypothetical protein
MCSIGVWKLGISGRQGAQSYLIFFLFHYPCYCSTACLHVHIASRLLITPSHLSRVQSHYISWPPSHGRRESAKVHRSIQQRTNPTSGPVESPAQLHCGCPTRPRSSPLRLDPQASPDGATRFPAYLANLSHTTHTTNLTICQSHPRSHHKSNIQFATRRQDCRLAQSV